MSHFDFVGGHDASDAVVVAVVPAVAVVVASSVHPASSSVGLPCRPIHGFWVVVGFAAVGFGGVRCLFRFLVLVVPLLVSP